MSSWPRYRECSTEICALELLRKILSDEIRTRSTRNMVQSRKLSEMLDGAINRYQNNLLSASEIIQELIDMAKEIRAADRRGEELGLTEDELAFYDALEVNDSAVEVLGDKVILPTNSGHAVKRLVVPQTLPG